MGFPGARRRTQLRPPARVGGSTPAAPRAADRSVGLVSLSRARPEAMASAIRWLSRSDSVTRSSHPRLRLRRVGAFEDEVPVQKDIERRSLRDRDGRRLIHPAPEDLDRYVRELLARRARRYLAGRRRRKDARLAGLAQLRDGADGGQEKSVAEHAGHVIIDVPD